MTVLACNNPRCLFVSPLSSVQEPFTHKPLLKQGERTLMGRATTGTNDESSNRLSGRAKRPPPSHEAESTAPNSAKRGRRNKSEVDSVPHTEGGHRSRAPSTRPAPAPAPDHPPFLLPQALVGSQGTRVRQSATILSLAHGYLRTPSTRILSSSSAPTKASNPSGGCNFITTSHSGVRTGLLSWYLHLAPRRPFR